MAAKVSIVEAYADASIEKKIRIILDNFDGFERLVDGYERCLTIQIRNEREYNRKKDQADLGVKVQTSGLSDTTARIAIENVMIEEAIKKGDIEDALKGAEEIERHRKEIITLRNMRDDYVLVSTQVQLLSGDELDMFNCYLEKRTGLMDMAEERGLSYNAIQKRLMKSKKIVVNQAVLFLTDKYKYA